MKTLGMYWIVVDQVLATGGDLERTRCDYVR